jgi:hypothetical protein
MLHKMNNQVYKWIYRSMLQELGDTTTVFIRSPNLEMLKICWTFKATCFDPWLLKMSLAGNINSCSAPKEYRRNFWDFPGGPLVPGLEMPLQETLALYIVWWLFWARHQSWGTEELSPPTLSYVRWSMQGWPYLQKLYFGGGHVTEAGQSQPPLGLWLK